MNQHQSIIINPIPIKQYFDDDQYFIRCSLQNLTKNLMLHLTASIIYKKVQLTLNQYLPNHQIYIYKVELKYEEKRKISQYIQGDQKYNNYSNVPFLQTLFTNGSIQLIQQEIQYLNESLDNSRFEQKNKLDYALSNSNQIEESELDNIIQKLNLFLICPSEQTINEFEKVFVTQEEIDQQYNNQILIIFKLKKADLLNLNIYSINLQPNSEPVILNFKEAEIINNNKESFQEIQSQFNKFIEVREINFFYITPENLKKFNLNIPNNRPIELFLTPYFLYKDLNRLQIETYLTFDHTQSQEEAKITILINIICKIQLKIEFKLSNCQYCHIMQNNGKIQMYFKLNHAPLCSAALYNNQKIDLFNISIPWHRIQNIFLNSYFQKHQNILEKYLILNNTIIEIQFNNFKLTHEIILFNSILLRLSYMKLLYHNEIELQYIFQVIRNNQFDILNSELNKSQLNFDQKYNFICLITENRIIDNHHLKSILIQIEKQLKSNADSQLNNEILDVTFQQFMRFSENLKKSIRISDLNNRNLSIFLRELKSSVSRFQYKNKYNKLILIKNIKLTPSGFIPMIRSYEKDKLIINLFDHQKFLKVILCDDDGYQMDKNTSKTGQIILVQLKEGIELFKEKFQLLGWNNTELKQDIFWMSKADKEFSNFLSNKFNYGFAILENLTQSRQNFGNFFLNGQSIEFKQLVIDDIDSKFMNHFGYISKNLICKIREKLNNQEVSAIQIIFNGIQYILQLNNQLKDDRIQINLSMTQQQDLNNIISIIDYNKLRGAYINSRIIEILIDNGIKGTVFVELLQCKLYSCIDVGHLKQIEIQKTQRYCSLDIKSEFYGILPIVEVMNIMKNNNLDENNCLFMKKVFQKLKKLEIQQIKSKYNILVDKAERLFGVIDNQGILNDGEVICISKPTDQIRYLEGELIIIGDCILCQKMILKVVGLSGRDIIDRHGDKKLYNEYSNCIIFSNKQYLNNEQCTNTYFVSWDQRLFPQNFGCNQKKSKIKVLNEINFIQSGQEELAKDLYDLFNTQILENIECDHLIINEKYNIQRDDMIFKILDQEMLKSLEQFQYINQKESNIDERFCNRFYWIKDMNNYEKYIQEYLKEYNIIQALLCLNHIVDTFNTWIQLYDIIDEYEIYSGYFENKKDDKNFRIFQEQMMINLGCLRMELNQILSEIKDERLIQIWLIHFIIVFLNEEQKIDNSQLKRIIESIRKQIRNYDKCQYLYSRLEKKSQQWFKGCSWYFFQKEIVNFEQSIQHKNDFV